MNTMLAIFNLGGGEILLILALVLILFGAKKLPELAKGLGQGIKEFKKATSDVTSEIHNAMEDNTPPKRIASTPVEAERTVPQSPAPAAPSPAAPAPVPSQKA
jgi:sec-independent protein translocase protein TatA